MLETYLEQIKNAKSKADLQELSYQAIRYLCDKDHNLICACCAWKENQLKAKTQTELDNCAKVLKIAKKYINKIK